MKLGQSWSGGYLDFLLLEAVLASHAQQKCMSAPTATISSGTIRGFTSLLPNSTSPVNKFLGIPFAAPPINDLRFGFPEPPVPWGNTSSILDTTAYANACFQANENITLLVGQSEDCLYLNVFAPSSKADDGRAVMVYIHGGGLVAGSAAEVTLDGTSLAANQGVVVVTINYRLNVFGFVNSPALPPADSNLGFYDQRMALAWVQANIAAFGGDPAKVTVFGESSGSTSVARLVETMVVDTPFRAAILESGWADTAAVMNEYSISDCGQGAWEALVAGVNCSSNSSDADAAAAEELWCVRGVDAWEMYYFLWNNTNILFTATNDNVTALSAPTQARIEGNVAQVPIMTGTNRNEGTLWTSAETLAAQLALYPQLVPFEAALADSYVVGAPGLPNQWYANAAIDTDVEYVCPTARAAGQTADYVAGGVPVWRYMYNATFANTDQPSDLAYPVVDGYGVYHSAELPLVWGTYDAVGATVREVLLSAAMQKAWADFAKNPYGAGPGWPRYNEVVNGSRPIAAWGSVDGNAVGWSVVANGTLDKNCWIYQALYQEFEGGIPWW